MDVITNHLGKAFVANKVLGWQVLVKALLFYVFF